MRNVMVHIFFRTAGSLSRLPAATAMLALVLALGGCASTPPPNESMNETQARLQTARDAGAADYAPVDLGFAQDKFQQAQAAFSDRKYADATNLAEESRADAELATAKARLGAARAQIQSKTQENASLRAEGQQVQAAAEQQEQQEQQQLQQLQQQQQQQTDPAGATSSSIPTPAPADMPAPSSSALSPSSQGGFQAMPEQQTLPDQTLPQPGQPPASSQPADPNNPNATNQGGHP
jgi:hypothetical protein